MGGFGSTRWGWRATRLTTAGLLALDVRALARADVLQPGTCCTWQWQQGGMPLGSVTLEARPGVVLLAYRVERANDGTWRMVRETIALQVTPCHFGGTRSWFRCPGCASRRAVLLCAGGLFRCRRCHDLAYASTRHGRAVDQTRGQVIESHVD